MTKTRRALAFFHDVMDDGEHFYWVGQPVFLPFIARALPLFLVGLVWFGIDYTFVGGAFPLFKAVSSGSLFLLLFFALHLAPFWIGCLNMLRMLLVYRNTFYAVTEKRIILRSGFFGIDYKAIDFDKISDLEVNVSPVDRLFNCGTIKIFTGRDDTPNRKFNGLQFTKLNNHIYSVRHHYQLFKNLKKLVTDVKTDWMYPNELRPATNSGYRTGYQGGAFPADQEQPSARASGGPSPGGD